MKMPERFQSRGGSGLSSTKAPPPSYKPVTDPIVVCSICNCEFRWLEWISVKKFMDRYICSECRNFANIYNAVVWLSFIEAVAKLDCQKPIEWTIECHHSELVILDIHDYYWCDLTCKCPPCVARRILRRPRVPRRVPPTYHPSTGYDRLAAHYVELPHSKEALDDASGSAI